MLYVYCLKSTCITTKLFSFLNNSDLSSNQTKEEKKLIILYSWDVFEILNDVTFTVHMAIIKSFI